MALESILASLLDLMSSTIGSPINIESYARDIQFSSWKGVLKIPQLLQRSLMEKIICLGLPWFNCGLLVKVFLTTKMVMQYHQKKLTSGKRWIFSCLVVAIYVIQYIGNSWKHIFHTSISSWYQIEFILLNLSLSSKYIVGHHCLFSPMST